MSSKSILPTSASGWLAKQPASMQEALKAHVKWVRYKTGQPLLQADRLPHQVMFIADGAVRLIADDPSKGPFTLARLGIGDALGWCGLIRGTPSETAIAMEPTLVAAISARQFLSLLKSDQSICQACLEPDRTELAELLFAWLQHQSHLYEDIPGLIAELWRPNALQLLTGSSLDNDFTFDQDWLWLLSAPNSSSNLFGMALDRWDVNQVKALSASLPLGARVLGISRAALQEALQARGISERSRSASSPAHPSAVQEFWDNATEAGDLPEPIDPRDLGLSSSTLKLPPLKERGEGPIDSSMVCLRRLANQYRFPFPRDMVSQILQDSEARLGGISLLHLGQILESLGLEVRPLSFPATQLHRMQPPALIRLEDRFLLIEEAGPKGLVVIDPSQGIVKLEREELQQLWPQGLSMLLVRQPASSDEDQLATKFDLSWFASVLKPYRPQVAVLFLAGFVEKLLELVFPLATIQIIQVVIGMGDIDLLMPIVVVMSIAIGVKVVLSILRNYMSSDLGDRVDTALGSQIVGHLFRLPLKFFDRRTVGDVSSRINDLQRVRQFITGTAIDTVIDTIFIPIIVVVLFALSPILAVVACIQIPITFATAWLSQKPKRRRVLKRNKAWSQAQGYLVEVISGIRTVKTQNFATQARWQWLDRYRKYAGEDYRLSKLGVVLRQIDDVKSRFTRIAIIGVGAMLAVNGIGSVGGLFGVLIISGSLSATLARVSKFNDQYENAKASMDSLADVLGQAPEESLDTSMMLPMPPIDGRIDFKRVTFSYKISGGNQIKDLDFTIKPGQIVGLVGSSGSGKSTTVQLIDGLYHPQEGRIFIDGSDVSKVQIGSLRRQIGFVPQESILFNGSVLDNLRLNFPDAPYEQVIAAAKVACAHEFIMNLPDGYNTKVGERGGGLSGGQKQRVAIARMVLQNPNLVILDEATSALDPTTEFLLMERLKERFAGQTMIFITHRVASLRDADRVLLMDQGIIIEDGSWNDLINLEGSFAALVEQQRSSSNA